MQRLISSILAASVLTVVKRPSNSYVAIYYRSNWFYIDDSDLTSKSTFSLLMQLFALQAGEVKSTVPILTLPLSR